MNSKDTKEVMTYALHRLLYIYQGNFLSRFLCLVVVCI